MKSNVIDLEVYLRHRTPNAILVDTGDMAKPVWLPLSQVEIEQDVGGFVEITLPEWLAMDKGLI